jgi:RNA polymerase sigma factor (sigma-70 family)
MRTNRTADLWREPQRRRLVRLCAMVSGDREAAEDLAQETLLEAWRNAHKLRDPSGAEHWLAAIARNVCRRWARRRGRDSVVDALGTELETVDAELGIEHTEVAEALDRALAQLPPETRAVLIGRYIEDLPHAEIGARLGLSEDAVSMRLSRGRSSLRRVIAPEPRDGEADAWQETRVWCTSCGRRRLLIWREPEAVAFRCPGCSRASAPSGRFPLGNPSFARLIGDLVRPASMLNRVDAWSHRYYEAGTGAEAPCTRCGRPVRLHAYHREAAALSEPEGRGLFARCTSCGEEVSSSLGALALAQPAGRRFRREHGRIRVLPEREVEFGGRPALVVCYESVLGSSGLDVVFARDTARVLAVHGAAN